MRSATALTVPSVTASLLTWIRMAIIIGGTGAASAMIFIGRQLIEHGFHDLNAIESPLKDPHLFLVIWAVLSCWAVCGQLSYVYSHDVVAQLRRNKDSKGNRAESDAVGTDDAIALNCGSGDQSKHDFSLSDEELD